MATRFYRVKPGFGVGAHLANPGSGAIFQLGMVLVLPNGFAAQEIQEVQALEFAASEISEKSTSAAFPCRTKSSGNTTCALLVDDMGFGCPTSL
jgi:hypothetical protein